MKRLIRAICLVIIVSVFSPVSVAHAMEEPLGVSIDDPTVYQDLIEPDDLLIIAPYSIPFTVSPDDPINKTFVFKVIDTDNVTELASVLGHAYYENGYGPGVVSFYFDNVTAPVWEGAYIIQVEENPAYYPAPQVWAFPLSTSDYTQTDGQSFNQAALRDEIVAIANDLSLTYPDDLLSAEETGTFLSSYGESYFRGAVHGLQSMCPALFVLQVRLADYTKRAWTSTFADNMTTQFAGTWFDSGITSLGDLYDTEQNTIWGFVILVLALGIVGLSYKQHKQIMPAMMDAFPVLLMGTILGMFSFMLLGLITFISVFAGGMVLFLNRA